MKKQIVVIGAGASGMTAAIFAAKQGAGVTLLEHTKHMGKKILATGNGKCNLSNERLDADCYRSAIPDFPMKVLEEFGVRQAVEFFQNLGIVIKSKDGYLYPYSGQAFSVAEVLKQELFLRKVQVKTECQIKQITKKGSKYKVETSIQDFEADAVILACGSKASPVTGSDGSGYKLAKKLGLSIVEPLPALVQLKCREKFYKQVSGVRMDAEVKLLIDGTEAASDFGEVQFTEYGISGIPVFQISRFASRALYHKKKVAAVLDFYPFVSYKKMYEMLTERKQLCMEKRMEDFLTGWFNSKMAALFLKLAGIDRNQPVFSLTDQEIKKLTGLIKEFATEVTETNSFEHAQVCCGGVDVRMVNPKTMEVKNRKGLYLIGELLDVDGICGGYNLQWAWSTGAIAGIHAGKNDDTN